MGKTPITIDIKPSDCENSSAENLGNAVYQFISVTLRSTLVLSLSQIKLFNHSLYLKPAVCKQMINIKLNHFIT